MAKGQGGNEDRAKVKLRVIEFELEGGNASVENSIRQLTQALTNRNGQSSPARGIVPPRQAKEIGAPEPNEPETEEYAEAPEVLEADAPDSDGAKANKSKARSTYKPPLPTYLHDLDMNGNGTSFKDYASTKPTKKHTVRYLIAAHWLKEHGDSPTVTTDKIYTCYKTAGWPLNITDWDINLRQQVKTDRFRAVNPGEYAITPLGDGDLQKLDGTA